MKFLRTMQSLKKIDPKKELGTKSSILGTEFPSLHFGLKTRKNSKNGCSSAAAAAGAAV